jgi:cytochrome c peroxidase
MYRTAPLAGLWSRQSRGFYHDGRFQNLDAVVQHYNEHLNLQLTDQESADLVDFLKSL